MSHITSLPPHNGHLSTMTTFLCPQDSHCGEVRMYLNTRYWQLIVQHRKLAPCICTHLIDELQSTTEVVLHLKEFGLQ